MNLKIKTNDVIFCVCLIMMTIYTICPLGILGIAFLFLLVIYLLNSMKDKLNFLFAIFYILTFQMISRTYTNGIVNLVFSYLDEFLTIIFVIYIIKDFLNKKNRLKKFEKRIVLYFCIFCIFCIISNITYKIQSIFPIIIDIITCSKFLIMYFFTRLFYQNNLSGRTIFNKSVVFKCRFIAILLFSLSILNILVPSLYSKFDYRYIMESLQLFFPHPTYLAATSILIIIILLSSRTKGNFKYIVLLSLVTIFTFRTKAIVTIFSIIIIYIGFYKFKIRAKTLWLGLILILGIYISYGQIQTYYYNTKVDTIRSDMTNDGIKLANEYFPLGTGFATYGSTAAFQFESTLYYKLGYFKGDYKAAAMGDVFWPAVIAQAGWIGAVFFVLVIIKFLLYILRSAKKQPLFFITSLSIFIYEIITSTAETAFFSPIVSSYFIALGLIISEIIKNEEERKNNKESILLGGN